MFFRTLHHIERVSHGGGGVVGEVPHCHIAQPCCLVEVGGHNVEVVSVIGHQPGKDGFGKETTIRETYNESSSRLENSVDFCEDFVGLNEIVNRDTTEDIVIGSIREEGERGVGVKIMDMVLRQALVHLHLFTVHTNTNHLGVLGC